jgi:hypothetical protein
MIKDIQINTGAFERLGWQPEINEGLLAQLLREQTNRVAVPDEKHLTLQIKPHPKQKNRLWGKGSLHKNGCYSRDRTVADVYLRPDEKQSNNTLLHETRHWVQDVTNMYPRSRTPKGRFIEIAKGLRHMPGTVVGYHAGAAVMGYLGYELTDSGPVGILTGYSVAMVGGVMLLEESLGLHTPWERDAYQFAADPTVQENYGEIIKYRQL